MLVRILVRLLLAARIGILAAVLACDMTSRSSASLDPDRAQLVALTLQAVTNQAQVTGISIMSGYALVTYTDGVNAGGELLASKASGSWQTVLASGGQFGATDPLQAAGVSSSVAQYLIANIQPVPANNEPTQPVAGSATYQSWTERCPTGNDPPAPQWYSQIVLGPDTVVGYQTGSIAPTTPTSAVALFVQPSYHPTVITLSGPSSNIIMSATVPVGANGGVAYYAPSAASGNYSFSVTGQNQGGGDCGTARGSTSTRTDTSWSGTLYL